MPRQDDIPQIQVVRKSELQLRFSEFNGLLFSQTNSQPASPPPLDEEYIKTIENELLKIDHDFLI